MTIGLSRKAGGSQSSSTFRILRDSSRDRVTMADIMLGKTRRCEGPG